MTPVKQVVVGTRLDLLSLSVNVTRPPVKGFDPGFEIEDKSEQQLLCPWVFLT